MKTAVMWELLLWKGGKTQIKVGANAIRPQMARSAKLRMPPSLDKRVRA